MTTNISGLEDIVDSFYRYKRPTILVVKEKTKIAITNLEEIAKSLDRDSSLIINYFKKRFGVNFVYKKEKLTTTGDIKAQDFEMALREFTEHLILCPNCRLPETQIRAKSSSLYMSCNCCSFSDKIKPQDKIILKCIDKMLQKK